MIEFHVTINGERTSVALPDANAIPVPAVAAAAVEAHDAYGRLMDARRDLRGAFASLDAAKESVKKKAAELAIKKSQLPKDIRKSIKEAEEVLAVAQLENGAQEEAFRHAYRALVAEVNANRKGLEKAAMDGAERSLQRMAAAREAFAAAAVDAHASYGLLGMLVENERQSRTLLKYRDASGSKRPVATDQALDAMGRAVGHANLDLAAYKRGTAPTKKEVEATDGEE